MEQNHKYALACMINPPEIQGRFTKWPLHITLVPWFKCEKPLSEVTSDLRKVIDNISTFDIETGEKAMFGPEHDVPVVLVKKTKELETLHARVYRCLLNNGCLVETEEYSRENFQPHITIRGDRTIASEETVQINSVDMVENLNDGKMGRRVVRRFNFSAINE